MLFEMPMLGSLCLCSIQNVGLACLCIVHHAGVGLHAPYVGTWFSTLSCHSTCGLWVSSAHVIQHGSIGLSTPLCCPICRVWVLLIFLREVEPVLVASTSGEWW